MAAVSASPSWVIEKCKGSGPAIQAVISLERKIFAKAESWYYNKQQHMHMRAYKHMQAYTNTY